MKIESVRAQVVRIPLDEPLADGPAYSRTHNQFVLVRIDTGDLQGIGVSFMGGMLSASLKLAIEQLGGLIIGEDPLQIEVLAHRLRTAGASAGPGASSDTTRSRQTNLRRLPAFIRVHGHPNRNQEALSLFGFREVKENA